jgi:hypothetical protein
MLEPQQFAIGPMMAMAARQEELHKAERRKLL